MEHVDPDVAFIDRLSRKNIAGMNDAQAALLKHLAASTFAPGETFDTICREMSWSKPAAATLRTLVRRGWVVVAGDLLGNPMYAITAAGRHALAERVRVMGDCADSLDYHYAHKERRWEQRTKRLTRRANSRRSRPRRRSGIRPILCWIGLAALVTMVLLAFVGCVSKRNTAEINAMSNSELRQHWDEIQYAMPDVGEEYRQSVRSAGVNRFGQDWGEEHRAWVLQRMIWPGMTAEQLYWSWGNPQRRFTDHYPVGTYEHWYWNVSAYTSGQEATLHNGVVIWYRIGDQ